MCRLFATLLFILVLAGQAHSTKYSSGKNRIIVIQTGHRHGWGWGWGGDHKVVHHHHGGHHGHGWGGWGGWSGGGGGWGWGWGKFILELAFFSLLTNDIMNIIF